MAVSGDGVGAGTWLIPVRVEGLWVGISALSDHMSWQGGELYDIIKNKHLSEPEASETIKIIKGMAKPQQPSGTTKDV